jgi:hypothetical protein
MNSFYFNIIRKNKFIFLMLLLLFSLLSVYVPHGLIETHEHHDYESLFKYVIYNNRPAANLRKLLKKLMSLLLKIYRLPQILSNMAVMANSRLVLFNLRFSKASILHLFSVLCSYFHGGKFKNTMLHPDLLPLMDV